MTTRIEELGTWRIVTRGAPTPTIAAEYICPVHGRFSVDAQRDANGDAPASVTCAAPCRELSPYAISAPRGKVKAVEVVRGGYQKPEAETWTNTENLGEGQDYDDWVADRDQVWERDRENSIKGLIE